MENQVDSVSNKRGLRGNYFLVLFLLITLSVVLFIALYLTGGISYIRRRSSLALYSFRNDQAYNVLMNLSPAESVLNEESAAKETDLFTQVVVFAGFLGDKLWVWPYEGLPAKFIATDMTTYGVAALVSDDDLKRSKIAQMVDNGELEVVDETSTKRHNYQGTLLIEKSHGNLSKKQFRKMIESGYLIKIVYNRFARDLVGILLLDFNKI